MMIMATRDKEAQYAAQLRELTDAELCARLRGRYGAVSDYKPDPIAVEAARRIERISEIVELWEKAGIL